MQQAHPGEVYLVKNNCRVIRTKERHLGKGEFGDIYLGSMGEDKQVACKFIPIHRSQHYQNSFNAEHKVYMRLLDKTVGPKSLMRYVGAENKMLPEGLHGVLLMDLLPRTTLGDFIDDCAAKKHQLPPHLVFNFAQQLIQAVAFLHRHKIAHGDLKADNVSINYVTMQLVLFDFGLSTVVTGRTQLSRNTTGSPMFMAPEILRESEKEERDRVPFDPFRADMWSFGQMCYHMMTGYAMFEKVFTLPALKALVQQRPDPTVGVEHNEFYRALIQATVVYHPPYDRLSAPQLEQLLEGLVKVHPPPTIEDEEEEEDSMICSEEGIVCS